MDIPKFAFEAAGQAAGYYFQLRFGLLRALKQIYKDPTGSISIERLDDVSLWSGAEPREVDQLKHTTNLSEVFSDNSPAVWRTVANWSKLLDVPGISATGLTFVLITNASVAPDSGIAKLGIDVGERDVDGAIDGLVKAASTSLNATTLVDRQLFLSLDMGHRKALVGAITVVANSPGLFALGTEIEETLHYACEASQLSSFREELEGWWMHKVAHGLGSDGATSIPLVEIDAKVSALRESHKRSLLSIDVDPDLSAAEDLVDHLFVQQMRAVQVGERRLRNAQRDFLRASTQRSKWVRDLKLDPAELGRYDTELEDHWAAKSAIMLDELGVDAPNENKHRAGRDLLGWAETHQIPIRGAAAQFLTSGSFHSLADQLRVGWHPDYKSLFKDR